jgi:hypothetical protein
MRVDSPRQRHSRPVLIMATITLTVFMASLSVGYEAATDSVRTAEAGSLGCKTGVGCTQVGGSRDGALSFTAWVRGQSYRPYVYVTLQIMVYNPLTRSLIWSDVKKTRAGADGLTPKLTTWVDCNAGSIIVEGYSWLTNAAGQGQPYGSKVIW